MTPDKPPASVPGTRHEENGSLDELLRRNRPMVEGYVRPRVRTRDDGDDLVQNVMLKATRYFPVFRQDCPFSQWLLRIAVNEVKNYYRRLAGERWDAFDDFDLENVADLQQSSRVPCPDQDTVEKVYVQKLRQCMEAVCSQDERNVMTMVYQGETFEEIGEILEFKSGTVRSHFLRGRTKLLAHLVAVEPDMVGGEPAIRKAAERAQGELDGLEQAALVQMDSRSTAFRSACAKIARYLELPCLLVSLWAMEGPWNL